MSTVPVARRGHWPGWSALHGREASERTARHRATVPASLTDNERVLTEVDFIDGGAVIGTDRALHMRPAGAMWRRIPWTDIESAGWSQAEATTVLRLWPPGAGASTELRLPTGKNFCAFAAEQASSTQLFTSRVQLTPASAATVTAVRESGAAAVTWQIRLDPGGDPRDPSIAPALDRTIAELQAIAGC